MLYFKNKSTTLKFSYITSKIKSLGIKKVYAFSLNDPNSTENDIMFLSPSIQSLASPSVA